MAHALEDLARIALAEDAPDGDITSRATIPEATRCEAELVIKRDGVLAGLEAAIAVFEVAAAEDGTTVEIDRKAGDGDRVRNGDRAALLRGDARTVLRAERPALNLLGHLSGIATLTRAYVDAAAPAAIRTCVSLIKMASDRDARCRVPPPAATAARSTARKPGSVLRVHRIAAGAAAST